MNGVPNDALRGRSGRGPDLRNWTTRDAVDHSRRKTERDAFEQLLAGFEELWRNLPKDEAK